MLERRKHLGVDERDEPVAPVVVGEAGQLAADADLVAGPVGAVGDLGDGAHDGRTGASRPALRQRSRS